MRRARLILPLLAVCVGRGTASAQLDVAGDIGVSHLRQAGIPEANALTFGAAFDATANNAFFHAAGLGARAGSDGTGQVVALFAIVDPSMRALRWQIDGSASAFGQTSALPATSAELAARLRLGDNARGVAIGAGGGEARQLAAAEPVVRALADGWWQADADKFAADLSVSHARFAVQSHAFPATQIVDRATYTDMAATWRRDRGGAVSVEVTGGLRAAASGGVSSGGWFAADGTVWLSHHAAVVVSAGRTLEDVVRGFPRASYTSVALRLSRGGHPALSDRGTPAGVRVAVRRVTAGAVTFDVIAPGASSVELMADFTDWATVPLVREGGVWRLEHAASPGAHRLALRLDGGDWIVPANLPSVADELGGNVGVITVP